MKKFILCIFIVLTKAVELTGCWCYEHDELKKIEWEIYKYEEAARVRFFDGVPCPFDTPREAWQFPYHEKIKNLNKTFLIKNPSRYPVTYHNILIFEQKIGVMADYYHESAYMNIFGPKVPYIAGSNKDKEEMVAQDRAKAKKKETIIRDTLDDSTTKIINIYLKLYEDCLDYHASLETYRDYGMLAHLNNNFEISHEMLHRLLEEAEKTGQLHTLDSKFYHELGSVCVEAMAYNEAIEYLSEAIQKDPTNKAAHFDRALAYFETGNFELALDDYLISDKGQDHSKDFRPTLVSEEFMKALIASTVKGTVEAGIEFIPSMCSTIYGLGETAWAMHIHPIDSSQKYAATCLEVGECIFDYCKNLDWDTLDEYSDQIKTLYERYDNLNDTEKGELIGYAIGRYGVEIFAGGAVFKGVRAARNLKHANRLCNLEAMAVSNANKEALAASAFKHAAERESYFRNVKIQWDKQNKHIPGKKDYRLTNSILEHDNPQGLLQKFAGKGKKVNNELAGNPGYKEVVDFEEHVGLWKTKDGKSCRPTTRGTIHYAKDGAHIVPARPEGKGL